MIIHIDSNKGQPSQQQVSAEMFKYKLSSVILPREKWRGDDDAKSCSRCEKAFMYLIRRKHHCRRCGQVFCSDCSENFLDGYFFSPESEKTVRFCVKCYDQLTRYLKRNGVDIQGTNNIITLSMAVEDERPEVEESKAVEPIIEGVADVAGEMHNDHEFNPDYEDHINVQALFADDEVAQPSPQKGTLSQEDLALYSADLKERSHQKVEQLCEFMAKKYTISPEWVQIMPVFIRKAVEDVNIDSISASGEPMDINFYVKIKRIPFIDQSVTGYFKGVVFRKNVTHKKMRTKFLNPKLMIITGNLEVTDNQGANNQQSFENLVNNERKHIKRIVDKIVKMKPDLLLIEKSANRYATELLLSANISVVQNIQYHILRKIAKCTRAKFINLEKVDKYQPEKVLGQATNLVFRQFNAEVIVQSKEVMDTLNEGQKDLLVEYIRENRERDNTLMFLETPSGQSGVTMTLSGPQVHQLKTVKKSMMGILRLARHFHLERELILYEYRLKHTLKQQLSKDQQLQINATTGDLSKFVYERMTIEDLIRKDFISYTKINYVQADLSNFNDIKDNHQALEQYFKENHLSNKSKLDFFAEICQIPTQKKIEFYSKDDTSLAAFILLKVSNMENRCQCRRSRFQHVSIYYGSGVYIKIAVESKFFISDQQDRPSLAQSGLDKRQHHPTIIERAVSMQMPTSPLFDQYQPQLQQQGIDVSTLNVLTQKDLAKALAKKHKSQNSQIKKVVIESYLECNLCNERISETVRLKKINMEYSFLRFLQHLFISGQHAKDPTVEKKDKCDHSLCSRVFAYEEAMVKFYVATFKYFSLSQISLTEERIVDSLRRWEVALIHQKREDLKSRLNNMKEKLITMVGKLQTQLDPKQSLLRTELDQLCTSITKIQHEALKRINEFKYKNVFEIDNDNQNLGNCFREIYENILEAKKRKEIGNDLRLMMKNNLIDLARDQVIKTEKDLDLELLREVPREVHSDGDAGSVKSDQEIFMTEELSELQAIRHKSGRNLRKSKTIVRKHQSQDLTTDDTTAAQPKQGSVTLLEERAQTELPIIEKAQTQQVRSSFMSSSQTLEVQKSTVITPAPATNDSKALEFNFMKEWPISSYPWEHEGGEKSIQKYEFVPLQENDHMSYIAFALNHQHYMHEVYLKHGFQNLEEQRFPDPLNSAQFTFVKTKIGFGKGDKERPPEPPATFTLRIFHEKPSKRFEQSPNLAAQTYQHPHTQSFQIQPTQVPLRSDDPHESLPLPLPDSTRVSQMNINLLTQPGKPPMPSSKLKYSEVIIYFPVQFEMLRMVNSIPLTQFIKSIASMTSWDTQGGKSDSSFFKSSDELFVFKKLQLDKEFLMFRDFAIEYFKHMWRLSYENKPSLLSKIYGMFEIRSRNQVGYYLAMENLFVGMGPQSGLQVYDLKGSKTNRWEQKKKRVLLDTNFKIDRNAEPIPVVRDNFRFIDRAFQNDCKFLFKQKVIDYSLLLIIDKKAQKIRLGIIDYLRYYTWDKETEHIIKLVLKGGMVPTIVNPQEYKKRFLEEMSKYFIDVSNDY